jgi:hypothetical protein
MYNTLDGFPRLLKHKVPCILYSFREQLQEIFTLMVPATGLHKHLNPPCWVSFDQQIIQLTEELTSPRLSLGLRRRVGFD